MLLKHLIFPYTFFSGESSAVSSVNSSAKPFWKTLKKSKGKLPCGCKLFSFQYHIFINNRAMVSILTDSNCIHLSYTKIIVMVMEHHYRAHNRKLKFRERIFWKFSLFLFFLSFSTTCLRKKWWSKLGGLWRVKKVAQLQKKFFFGNFK